MGRSTGTFLSARLLVALLLSFAVGSRQAYAQSAPSDPSQETLTNLALFNRCYAHITGRRLPKNHPMRAQVATGAKNAVDACMEILDYATLLNTSTLATDGTLKYGSDPAKQAEALQVLRNFNHFHQSWFPNDSIVNSVPEGADFYEKTPWLHDEAESALHVTRALLGENVKYSEVITQTTSMEALRTSGPRQENPADAKKIATYVAGANDDGEAGRGHAWLHPWLVQTGELLGIRKMSLNPDKWNGVGHTSQIAAPFPEPNKSFPYDIYWNRPLGGGIIGTQSYLVLNLGRTDYLRMNGGFRQNRRWAKAALTDLMCRDLPALRVSDVVPYVENNPTDDTPPFRKSRNCMACHTTLDPFASTIRNVSYMPMPERWGTGNSQISTTMAIQWPVTMPRETGQVDKDQDFYQRPRNGRLHYRSFSGDLVKKDVNGPAELGQAIAEQDDLYVCAASRYFQYFTGIQVSLQDAGDPSKEPLSPSDQAYRDEVIALGRALKQDPSQNLRKLIRSILESDVYKTRAMRSYGQVGSGGN